MTLADLHLATAATGAVLGLLGGLAVPGLIARIPEPDPEPEPDPDLDLGPDERLDPEAGERDAVLPEPKEPYAAIAATRGLRTRAAVSGAVAAALVGSAVGWAWSLTFLWFLVPVCVALAVVDWRTRLLPTKVIAPSYLVVVPLVLGSAALDHSTWYLVTSGIGWLLFGGFFFLLWFVYPAGLGYGDVRLAGLLGIALGYLSLQTVSYGMVAGSLLNVVVGGGLVLLGRVDRGSSPFGPYLVLGALVGVLLAPGASGWYA